jgi:hypothetical protein
VADQLTRETIAFLDAFDRLRLDPDTLTPSSAADSNVVRKQAARIACQRANPVFTTIGITAITAC